MTPEWNCPTAFVRCQRTLKWIESETPAQFKVWTLSIPTSSWPAPIGRPKERGVLDSALTLRHPAVVLNPHQLAKRHASINRHTVFLFLLYAISSSQTACRTYKRRLQGLSIHNLVDTCFSYHDLKHIVLSCCHGPILFLAECVHSRHPRHPLHHTFLGLIPDRHRLSCRPGAEGWPEGKNCHQGVSLEMEHRRILPILSRRGCLHTAIVLDCLYGVKT